MPRGALFSAYGRKRERGERKGGEREEKEGEKGGEREGLEGVSSLVTLFTLNSVFYKLYKLTSSFTTAKRTQNLVFVLYPKRAPSSTYLQPKLQNCSVFPGHETGYTYCLYT